MPMTPPRGSPVTHASDASAMSIRRPGRELIFIACKGCAGQRATEQPSLQPRPRQHGKSRSINFSLRRDSR
ncbi:hypothetical protein BC936DRAFT_144558 [Jimgerdemannia flammicorona]|uniref:Uncharacterized protein n=1 Tax=Jimgerdemannia flammicorona TaxID=994334 RepID=A0A433DC83_9FUNG|nr:hypothetical protein BC936DRAFT_144558 [Jimgerdemannia flammicorona]